MLVIFLLNKLLKSCYITGYLSLSLSALTVLHAIFENSIQIYFIVTYVWREKGKREREGRLNFPFTRQMQPKNEYSNMAEKGEK